ncbi:peptidoglycan-associated lipoprotein [Orientia tsutsugamushi]|uniref:peptidoglycan-associated lipoprotein Pal n=1 Tax=Orientia tsutsugamushi TaxID=784 RepID=UPI00061EDFB4|nr:peptidoglycan-associated lipoprotein Pal [Orientia tsutsugamushi]KJV74576.1 peptidoglycan-associated lipoprotein [Orientia tsutsugamushi str. TA763]SPP24677.1 peptidoglycan-associated lipoprotein [Orientia tsutsugamushi]
MIKKSIISICVLVLLSGYKWKCLWQRSKHSNFISKVVGTKDFKEDNDDIVGMISSINAESSDQVTSNNANAQQAEYVDVKHEQFLQAIHGKHKVYFATEKFDLSEESKRVLRAQSTWLKSNPDVKIIIEGHCDERGTREYNLALGKKRADAVKQFLVTLGVSRDKIETTSYGKDKPEVEVTKDNKEEAYRLNRRSVTIIKSNIA